MSVARGRLAGLLLLVACKAESLGIDLPKGGRDAITMEDLSRDTWNLTSAGPSRAPGQPGAQEAATRLHRRFAEVHVLPAFGDDYVARAGAGSMVCAVRDGRSGRAVLVLALDSGVGAVGAVNTASLVSLAKSLDGPSPPEHSWVFCALPAADGPAAFAAKPAWPLDQLASVWILGPFGGEKVEQTQSAAIPGIPATALGTEALDWHGTEADLMDRYDFRRVTDQVREVYDRLTAPPPP